MKEDHGGRVARAAVWLENERTGMQVGNRLVINNSSKLKAF